MTLQVWVNPDRKKRNVPQARRLARLICNALCLLASLAMLETGAVRAETPNTLIDLPENVDRHMMAMMRSEGVRGAAVVVAHEGRIIYAKGYGYADPVGKQPYDPDTTVANLFSVSKPVSTLAILSRAHAMELDLDRDVNTYLKRIQLAPHPGGPVTLRRLLSHSAGLSDNFRNEVALVSQHRTPLEIHVPRQPPQRRMPAGSIIAYTNNAINLAALTVADAAGTTFAELLNNELVQPAGLRSLSADWPSNAVAARRYSYLHEGPWLAGRALPPFTTNPEPSGGLIATPRDMGRVLLLLLEGGRLEGRQIIPRQVVEMMMTPQAAAAPGLSANGLGIRLHRMGGKRFIEHAGENRNALMMLPDQRFGMYMVTTRHVHAAALYPTFRAIASTWFDLPPDAAPPERPAGLVARAHAGLYLDARLVEGVAWRLGSAFARPGTAGARLNWTIAFDRGGNLTLNGERFSEVSPGLFRAVEARQLRTGELQWLKLGVLPDGTQTATLDLAGMLRLPWYRQPAMVRGVIGGLCLLLAGMTAALTLRNRTAMVDRLLVLLTATGVLGLPAIAFLFFRNGDRYVVEVAPEPLLLMVAPWLPIMAVAPALLLAWRARGRRNRLAWIWLGSVSLLLGALAVMSAG